MPRRNDDEPGTIDPGRRHTGPHWIKSGGTTWTPPACVFLDTETTPEMVGDVEVHRLRLWCASLVVRRHRSQRRVGTTGAAGATGDQLAAWLTDATRGLQSVWLWAHNLAFDLVASRLTEHLVGHGWSLSSVSIAGRSTVVRMSHGNRTLTMVDSTSWLAAPLRVIGTLVQVEKPPLPAWSDTDEAWRERCQADVAILERAVLELLDWWDRSGLGHWGPTGASTGMATIRRHLRPLSVMTDTDPEARRWERQAIYGGCRDLAVNGPLGDGPFVVLDFRATYPTLAGALRLPAVPKGWTRDVDVAGLCEDQHKYGWIADVTVASEHPSVPARWQPDVVHPVGTWRAVLAGEELQEAARAGKVLEVHRARRWWLDRTHDTWSAWVLGILNGDDPDVPGVVRLAAKGWSRSALGKWAGRTSESHQRGPSWSPSWALMRGWDAFTRSDALLVELAGQRLWIVRNLEPMDALPALFAWVEASCRVRLRAALDALGEGTWVQADTDGMICSVPALRRWVRRTDPAAVVSRRPVDVAAAACALLAPLVAPLELRTKAVWDQLLAIGPQHLVSSSERRLSGVAAGAVETAPGRFTARVWPGLPWQLQHAELGGFGRPEVTTTLPGMTAHRWALETGRLRPLETRLAADGGWEALRWPETRWAAAGAVLGLNQWRRLAALVD